MIHPLSKFKQNRNASIVRLFTELHVEQDGVTPTKKKVISTIEKKLHCSFNTIWGILEKQNLVGKDSKP